MLASVPYQQYSREGLEALSKVLEEHRAMLSVDPDSGHLTVENEDDDDEDAWSSSGGSG